jgi:hypothetical protein
MDDNGNTDASWARGRRVAGKSPPVFPLRNVVNERKTGVSMADTQRHPFLHGLSKHRGAPPTVVVIFGASGDLTARKLIPAIYNLSSDNLLPADFFLVGFGRKPMSNEEFRAVAADAIKEFSRRELSPDIWERVARNTSYVAGGYDEPEAFQRLAKHTDAIEKNLGRDLQRLFYVSTPPSVFAPIVGCSTSRRHLQFSRQLSSTSVRVASRPNTSVGRITQRW